MRVKLDENLPEWGKVYFDAAGQDATTAAEEGLCGAGDPALAAAARDEGRAFVTLDLDFAEILAYPPREYAGLVVLRPGRALLPIISRLLEDTADALRLMDPRGKLWIVEPVRIRVLGDEPET